MKKILCILLALSILLSCAIISTSAEEAKDTPIILIHGMMGWGEDSDQWDSNPYFGMGAGSLPEMLRENGYTVYAPSVSPMGSVHDRCCELYAKLTGTIVDYGEAHSQKYGHERYGRDYTGQALIENWDFDEIILIGHSFGSPTAKAFASLCAYGDADEREASGDDVSPLFAGGHEDTVKAVIGFVGPYNGSTLSNLMMTPVLGSIYCIGMNIASVTGAMDFMLDEWGLSDKFSISKSIKLLNSHDHCGYEMTIGGAREMNEKYPDNASTIYISLAASMTQMNENGNVTISSGTMAFMKATALIQKLYAGKTVDGIELSEDWAMTDGMVPLPAARCPYGSECVEWDFGEELTAGVWNMAPVRYNSSHGYGCSPAGQTTEEFLQMYISLIDSVI